MFLFGELRVCPRCAAAPPAPVSERRKNLAKAAYVAAVWSTVMMVLLFVGAFRGSGEGEYNALGFAILVPSVAGVAMAATALEKRLHNPPFVRVPFYWNGGLLAIYMVLIFIGNCK
jgi:hypothetical protein